MNSYNSWQKIKVPVTSYKPILSRNQRLLPIDLRQLIVLPIRNFAPMIVEETKPTRLSRLPAGTRAVIHSHEDSDFQLTLMEMGCIPGEPVWVEMIAPMGDPLAIRIAGYFLSLRKKDAEKIWVVITGKDTV